MGNDEDAALGSLGDPSRRAIVELLAGRPSSVGDLAEQLPITRQGVSQHLAAFTESKLVIATPEGTRRIFRLNPTVSTPCAPTSNGSGTPP